MRLQLVLVLVQFRWLTSHNTPSSPRSTAALTGEAIFGEDVIKNEYIVKVLVSVNF